MMRVKWFQLIVNALMCAACVGFSWLPAERGVHIAVTGVGVASGMLFGMYLHEAIWAKPHNALLELCDMDRRSA